MVVPAQELVLLPLPKSISNAWRYEMGYDDQEVCLRDAILSIDGIQVTATKTFTRDPRLLSIVDAVYKPAPKQERKQVSRIPNDLKWCMVCGDIRPKSYFAYHRDTFDHLDPRCRQCENERKRNAYATKIGREPRAYARQEQKAS